MKIKQIIFQLLLSFLLLAIVSKFTGGILFANSITYIAMFLCFYGAATLASSRIRSFFLLPSGPVFDALIHVVILMVVFYLSHSLLGGITIKAVNFPSFVFFGGKVIGTSLGLFGTIAVLSAQIGLAYQTLIWLNTEK